MRRAHIIARCRQEIAGHLWDRGERGVIPYDLAVTLGDDMVLIERVETAAPIDDVGIVTAPQHRMQQPAEGRSRRRKRGLP